MKNFSEKQARMYNLITIHGLNLIDFFDLPKHTAPVKLCKKLHSLEIKLNRIMCNMCNTNNVEGIEPSRENNWQPPETTEEAQDELLKAYMQKLLKIIGPKNAEKVFFNHDPRGYSMKMTTEASKAWPGHKDWGGYGIIAPDLTPER